MGNIQILDSHLVQRIAAGEIIERPLNVLKELLENSLDAGATQIETDLTGGGIESLSVTDNGCGMEEKDAVLALQRHTTSKISQFDDLERLKTFGFRGEAMASIASVSRLELLTRREEDLDGTKILAEGGTIQKISPAGTSRGTQVTARDLFFNVPARRKFLKSTQTEEAACLDLIGKISLAHLPVGFRMKKNGKAVTTLSPGESLLDRYLALFPQTRENQLFPLENSCNSLRLTGVFGAPLYSKSTKNSIFFFVNQRLVRPGIFFQAVLDGYSGYLEAGKYPVALLFLEIDGKFVDVNVHPAKTEVRFSHPKEVYAFVEKSIASRLRESREDVRPHVIPFYQEVSEAFDSLPARHEQASELTPNARSYSSYPLPRQGETPFRKFQDLTLFESLAPYEVREKTPELLGAIAKTYGIFREGNTLFLMDLHNAHERINYDLLEARWKEKKRPAQELLTPLLLQLSANQKALVIQHEEFFRETGLVVERFGEDTFRLRAVPSGLERLGEEKFFFSLLERLGTMDNLKETETLQEKILATMACRSSIQAGDEVPDPEMRSLLERLLRSSNPYFCPFGRPILVKITLDEIHKLFRRK